MNTDNITWNVEHSSNNNDEFVNIQNEIFQKFDDLICLQITQLFLGKDINQDVFDEIYEKTKNVCELSYIECDEDYIECVLSVILLKACDGSADYWYKIDKIEYYSRVFRLTFRDYIKKINNNEKYNEIKNSLMLSSTAVINSYVNDGVNLNTTISHTHKYYQRMKKEWEDNLCFSKLWQDRDFENLSWEGDRTAFFSLYILDQLAFIKQIEKFKDPYSIKMALHAIDNEVDFSDWCNLLASSEISFDNKYNFDNSKLLSPLLLYLADYKINSLVHAYGINTQTETEKLNELCTKIDSIINSIVKFLSEQDRSFLLHRWVIYNFMEIRNKEILRELKKEPNTIPDVHLYTHTQWLLSYIENTESFITYKDEKLQVWNNILGYETWYQYVLFSMWSAEKDVDNASVVDGFFDGWIFDNKKWYKNKAQNFREESETFKFYGDYFKNEENKYYYIAKLLFLSIKKKKSLDTWFKLLNSSEVCLDILNYQKESRDICKFDNRQESISYLQLLSIVGIHTLDILVQESNQHVEKFYHSLYNLIFKYYRTDHFKINKIWLSFISQLMLRRILYSNDSNSSEFTILDTAIPKLDDYFTKLKGQHLDLFHMIYFLHNNGVADTVITDALKEANINLTTVLEEYQRLHELNPKHYEISTYAENVISKYCE